jgi:hypothetical protein
VIRTMPYAELEETLGFDGPYRDPPRNRAPMMALAAVCTLALGVVGLMVTILALALTPPAWWPQRTMDVQAARLHAREIENAATQLASAVRTSDEKWSVMLKQEDANTWLEQRLHGWVESTYAPWPDALGRVAVRFDEGRIIIGAELCGDRAGDDSGETLPIASFVLEPWIGHDQLARLTLREVRYNRVVIPKGVAERRLTEAMARALEREQTELAPFFAALQGQAIPEPPVLSLGDGRRVHLVGIETLPGALVLHCETRSPTQSARR